MKIRRPSKKISTILFTMVVLFSMISVPTFGTHASDPSSLRIHLPIKIKGNEQFIRHNGVTSGSGTKEDPFVISNWSIYSFFKPGIKIENTTAYFEIRNCSITGMSRNVSVGISFSEVRNGTIRKCMVTRHKWGISLGWSSNNTIENCTVSGCVSGFVIDDGGEKAFVCPSQNNMIRHCNFSYCDHGVYCCCQPNARNNVYDSCNFTNNKIGVRLDHNIHYATIVRCNISENSEIGLKIWSCSSWNHISDNIFWNNGQHALDNCDTEWDNGPVYRGNFWSGHNSSQPYHIPGAGGNVDHYPLAKPIIDTDIVVSRFTYQPRAALVGDEVLFDASLSYDPTRNISLYEWDFGDGTFATGCMVTHAFQEEGTYNVTLRISSGNLTDWSVQQIRVVQRYTGCINVTSGGSIQDALNNAQPGFRILVHQGVYHETIVISTPYVTIEGDSPGLTIIDGNQQNDVVTIHSSSIILSGFTITNSSPNGSGITIGILDYQQDAVGCTISNNVIKGTTYAIQMYESEEDTIENNTLENNTYGIYAERSFNNTIKNNFISENTVGVWFFWGANWNRLTGNIIDRNTVGMDLNCSYYGYIIRNNITNNIIGLKMRYAILNEVIYNNVQGNTQYGLLILELQTSRNNFTHNWYGSKYGPSGLLPLFGDRVLFGYEHGQSTLLYGRVLNFMYCRPWEKQPVTIN